MSAYVPRRLLFLSDTAVSKTPEKTSFAARCLLSRSTDGYMRHKALQSIIKLRQAWVAPFIIRLAGEYVVEIIDHIVAELPTFERAVYRNFTLENRTLMRHLRSRALSYWNVYYRSSYPDRGAYPGLIVLDELARWAS